MEQEFDLIIAGGGLAGLSLGILCKKKGFRVLILEKGSYPRHKVCGEFISLESLNFLNRLGLDLSQDDFPKISKFHLTTEYGNSGTCRLNPGGVGVSRYFLDHRLRQIAENQGCIVLENTTVKEITHDGKGVIDISGKIYRGKLVVGALGKSSKNQTKFFGVKYHVNRGPDLDTIEIHHFKGGYCGISAIEANKFCLCYLSRAEGLKSFQGNIQKFEEEVVFKNGFLKKRFEAARIMEGVTTSGIGFGIQPTDNKYYPVLGDAGGFIPPLTGNGMSLAFRSAAWIFPEVCNYLEGKSNIHHLLQHQSNYIQGYLKKRIRAGIFLQDLLFVEQPLFHQLLMKGITRIPGLLNVLSGLAVGKTF